MSDQDLLIVDPVEHAQPERRHAAEAPLVDKKDVSRGRCQTDALGPWQIEKLPRVGYVGSGRIGSMKYFVLAPAERKGCRRIVGMPVQDDPVWFRRDDDRAAAVAPGEAADIEPDDLLLAIGDRGIFVDRHRRSPGTCAHSEDGCCDGCSAASTVA
ncbi:MAG: hypothetical protein KDH15_19890 [Rhodocyclaceae bacterium]|nr:hypothetical protein [Rhodocyclaceae bacterium]